MLVPGRVTANGFSSALGASLYSPRYRRSHLQVPNGMESGTSARAVPSLPVVADCAATATPAERISKSTGSPTIGVPVSDRVSRADSVASSPCSTLVSPV